MTGQVAVQYALSKAYKVRLLVRDSKTIPESFADKVDVVNGDVTKYEDVEKAVEGQDRVVVVLGTRNNVEPTTMMREGMKNIVEAMRKHGLKKVSVCLSSFLYWEPEKVPKVMSNINDDHKAMFEVLKNAMDLEWRALLPPHIAAEAEGKFQVEHEKPVEGCRIVSKADLGKFLVDCLDQEEHVHKRCGMGTVPQA